MRGLPLVIALLVFLPCAWCADDLNVLGEEYDGIPAQKMMERYLHAEAKACFPKRTEAYEAVKTPEDVAAYQTRMRDFFIEQLGGFPERTPLNAQITGEGDGDGFRYQNILYESQPGVRVSALLYLPLTPPPYPGVLVPCGHSGNGKAAETYQRASILIARNGMAALCYDPMGQGERYAYFKENGSTLIGTTQHHTVEGVGSILTGTNMAMYFIWDGMRGIDYLVSRAEIDPERIGCTGNSGGGTLTSYIMALDARVKCAAPSCFLTSIERLLDTIGPQDAEQNIFGQVAFGLDHAEYIILRAPKPTLLCAARQDFFDIDGTWDTFRQAKRIYTRMGFSERVDLIDVDDKHGFSQPRREAAVRWLRRWLLGIDEPITEPEFALLTDEQVQCSPKGQVYWMDGARTATDLNTERAERFAAQRAKLWDEAPRDVALDKVREIIGVPRRNTDKRSCQAEPVGTLEREGYRIEKLVLRAGPDILLPALAFVPEGPPKEAVLYCNGISKAKDAGPGGPLETLVLQGNYVLSVDLRGIGETEDPTNDKGWKWSVGVDWVDYFRAYQLGRTYVGMRVDDILACATFLGIRLPEDTPLRLTATGEATVPALHAAALEAHLFTSVKLEGGIPSWLEVVQTRRARAQLINAVHAALEWYDLPDLAGTLPPGRLTIMEPSVPQF